MPKKYALRERLLIGKLIYEKRMTVSSAAVSFNINYYTARDYYRDYKARIAADPEFEIASVDGASPDQISLVDTESDDASAFERWDAYGFEEND